MPRTAQPRQLITVEAAAAYLGLNTRTLRRYIADGKLPAKLCPVHTDDVSDIAKAEFCWTLLYPSRRDDFRAAHGAEAER